MSRDQEQYTKGYEDATTIKNVEVERLIKEKNDLRLWLREQGLLLEMAKDEILLLEDENEELRKQLVQWMGRINLIDQARHQLCA